MPLKLVTRKIILTASFIILPFQNNFVQAGISSFDCQIQGSHERTIWDELHEDLEIILLDEQFHNENEQTKNETLSDFLTKWNFLAIGPHAKFLNKKTWMSPDYETKFANFTYPPGIDIERQCFIGYQNLAAIRCMMGAVEPTDWMSSIVNARKRKEQHAKGWASEIVVSPWWISEEVDPLHLDDSFICLHDVFDALSPPATVDLVLDSRWPLKPHVILRAMETIWGVGQLYAMGESIDAPPKEFNLIEDNRIYFFSVLAWAARAPWPMTPKFALDRYYNFEVPKVVSSENMHKINVGEKVFYDYDIIFNENKIEFDKGLFLSDVESQKYLIEFGTQKWCKKSSKNNEKKFKILAIGAHMGSNMEPMSLLKELFEEDCGKNTFEGHVLGTVHPNEMLICKMFGYCDKQNEIRQIMIKISMDVLQEGGSSFDLMNARQRLQEVVNNEDIIKQSDLIVCAQPMPVCSVLRSLIPQPFLLYFAFPLLGGTPNSLKAPLLQNFNEMMYNPNRNFFITYNILLAQQIKALLGVEPMIALPASKYVLHSISEPKAIWNPNKIYRRIGVWRHPQIVEKVNKGLLCVPQAHTFYASGEVLRTISMMAFFADQVNLTATFYMQAGGMTESFKKWATRPNTFLDKYLNPLIGAFTYHDLSQYSFGIHWPWDFGMLFVSELYNIGVPLFVPSREWMALSVWRLLRLGAKGFWQGRSESWDGFVNGMRSGVEMPICWLNNYSSFQDVMSIATVTDFEILPGMTQFSSLPHLIELLDKFLSQDDPTFNSITIHNKMRSFHHKSFERSKNVFRKALSVLKPLGEGFVKETDLVRARRIESLRPARLMTKDYTAAVYPGNSACWTNGYTWDKCCNPLKYPDGWGRF